MNKTYEQQVDYGIKTREELDSIFAKYLFEVEMDSFDDNIEITVRETAITKFLVLPIEVLNELQKANYVIKSISPELEDIDGETFAILKIIVQWPIE